MGELMNTMITKELSEAYETAISYIFHLMPMSEMDIDSVIAEDVIIYGITVDENIFGIDDFKDVMNMQAEEMEGLEISYERVSVSQHHSDDGSTGMFVEEVNMTVNDGDAVSINNVRMSFVMENINGSWKLIHAHGSKPVDSEQDFWHVKEWKAEKEKLEQKVAEQTADLKKKNLELEIEAATERIRSRAMAMEKPDDIWKVLGVIKNEIEAFEMGNISTWLFTFTEDGKVIHREMADYNLDGEVQDNHSVFDPNKYSAAKKVVDKWGKDFFSLKFEGESLLDYLDSVSEIDPEQTQNFRQAIEAGHITEFWQHCSSFSKGIIGISFIETPPEKARQVVVKVTEAFGLAYKRYEDLQQAEKRRKAAELEAAVERVRAHAMGMQEPNDIMHVLNVMKEEVDKFELGNIATWIWTKDDDGMITQWDISEVTEEGNLVNFNLKFDINKWPEVNRHAKEWKKGKKYYALNWRGKKLQDIVDEVGEVDPESGKFFQEAVDSGHIKDYWHAAAPFSKGVVGLDFTSAPPDTTEAILLKMSSAFDMAYQRFEDLQKAEAQTREAQINLAVERVRARALAMFESTEILEVVKKLRDEMMGLNIPNVTAAAIHLREPDGMYRVWDLTSITIDDGEIHAPVDIRYDLEDTHPDFFMRKIWNNTSDYFVVVQELAELKHTIQWRRDNGQTEAANEMEKLSKSSSIERAYHPTVPLENGRLNIDTLDSPTPEVETILKKMAGAFDLAYKRFEDLKKSEKQAYESKVEASLERVRGMAAAMNHSDDLVQIAEEMFKELEIITINPLRYGLGMIDGETKEAELWASTVDDGHYLDKLGVLPLTWHPMLQQAFVAWEAQHEEVIYELKGAELNDYYREIGKVNPGIPNLDKLKDPDTDIVQFASFFPFKTGALYAFTAGKPGEEGRTILKRFANVFEQAHIRYDDLQTAEKQARQIREERDRLADTLMELRAAQDQLVQQEKLASLGQLTAGIAHEIKNPLNFVNNFSDVSLELVEEIRDEVRRMTEDRGREIEKGDTPLLRGDGDPSFDGSARGVSGGAKSDNQNDITETDTNSVNTPLNPLSRGEVGLSHDPDLILEILDDIETNLKTIHKHGTRADSIVKSMLQHSRGGDGIMEPTSLNPLIKEYVNLAFHGMRAGKEPINVDIDLQLDDEVGEVPLIAEDFSRVILNLTNNAFDAMKEKMTGDGRPETGEKSPLEESVEAERSRGVSSVEAYQPKLTVRTHQAEKTVTIEIEDNGSGIPGEMKDKILQPFFTTKKGTQGTGLGLSITNDILKAHGGEIAIESVEGEKTRFIINIPRG
jgi:signal transduction histidine kinase